MKPYFSGQSNLRVTEDDLLLYQHRLVIPKTMQRQMLQRIHDDGHMSLHKCIKRASQSVWWKNISKDLKLYTEACEFCQKHRRSHKKEPLQPTPLPRLPWTKVGIDIFHYKGKNFLLIVDYFSRWIEMPQLRYLTSTEVINHLTNQFARWGVPEEIRSDGGPQLVPGEFKRFCNSFNVQHSVSSPYNSQSNGAAERAVQTDKRIIQQENPALALLSYRSTPLEITGFSPAQLMMGRNLRTRLPISDYELTPKWPEFDVVKENDEQAKLKNEQNFNRTFGARKLPEIQPNSKVRIKLPSEKVWSDKKQISDKLSDRQYLIRNRRFLQSCPVTDEYLGQNFNDGGGNNDNHLKNNVLRRSARVPKPVVKYQA